MVADLINVNDISKTKPTKRRDNFLCCDATDRLWYSIQQQKQQTLWIFESHSSISVINELPALAWLDLTSEMASLMTIQQNSMICKTLHSELLRIEYSNQIAHQNTYFYDGFVFVFRRSNNRSFGFCWTKCESIYIFRYESLGSWTMNHKITIHKML